ncbi:MAG: hypothetical protein IPN13_23740 [Bacteroidetes bacterium]|nr:hypothetical protein [Bacteroidota bacterium]
MTTKSTGDCFVSVSKEVGVTIEYVGDVYYSGNPYQVDQQVTGSGKLIRQ